MTTKSIKTNKYSLSDCIKLPLSGDSVSMTASPGPAVLPDILETTRSMAEISSTNPSVSKAPESNLSISQLLKTKEWLQQQLDDVRVASKAGKLPSLNADDPDKVDEGTEKLQTELLEVSSCHSQQSLILKRLVLGQSLLKHLYGDDGSKEEIDPEKKKILTDLLLKQCDLVSKCMEIHKSVQSLRARRDTLNQENFDLHISNRTMMSELQDRSEGLHKKAEIFSKHPAIERSHDELDKNIAKIVVARQTLQGLILGSGINWEQDPDMQELLLSLGRPMDI